MIKLIAIDLDGTLLNNNMEISEENKKAILEAKSKGVKVVICTGRPYVFTKMYIHLLQLDTPTIMFNGGVIKYQDFNKETFLRKDQVFQTVSLLHQKSVSYMLYTEDTVYYIPSKRVTYLKKMSLHVPEDIRAKFVEITDYQSLVQEHDFHKVLIVEQDEEKYPILYDYLKETLKDCDIVQSSSFYIEVLPKGISKGNALQMVSDYYGIQAEDIMAIGDQENDRSMVQFAGIGVAMENANQSLKEVADYITDSNESDGVSKAIKKYVL